VEKSLAVYLRLLDVGGHPDDPSFLLSLKSLRRRWSERGNLNRVIQSNKIPREFRYKKSKTRCSGSSEHAWMKTVLHIGMTVLLLTTLDLIIKKEVTAASRRNGLSYIVDGWRACGDLRLGLSSMSV
ncbi:hypothetical protein FHG87_024734, partial [Trinorchestia longiramus]